MAKPITKNKIGKNLIISITAQVISMSTSFLLGFIVPKFIDLFQYSYWQTYLLYSSYVVILQFGLIDGIVLRYSQYDYDELDKPRVRSQFQLLVSFTSILMLVGFIISSILTNTLNREILMLVSISIVTKNIVGYTSYTFQITNRISKYALYVITQRVVYAIFVIIFLLCGLNDFYWYCIADLLGDLFGIVFGACFNRGMYFGKSIGFRETLKECKLNVLAGLMLMIANFASTFIVSGAKLLINLRWDDLTFGQVSFSFNVTNTFLNFVLSISVVLFPSLKRMAQEELPLIYKKISNILSPILFLVLLGYFPGCWILNIWLPKYNDSLLYLGILLPIIIFSSKISLLTNNYLKAYRKERTMLFINVGTVIIGMILCCISAYLFQSLEMVLYSLVFVIICRSIVSEIVVSKTIKIPIRSNLIAEILMTLDFIICVRVFSRWWACLIYSCSLVIYMIIYRKTIIDFCHKIRSIIVRKK